MAPGPNGSIARPKRLSSSARDSRRSTSACVELDDLRDQQDLAGDAFLVERGLHALVDQPLVGGVLVDDDEAVAGLRHDVGVVHLGARGAERAVEQVGRGLGDLDAGGGGRGADVEHGLRGFGKARIGRSSRRATAPRGGSGRDGERRQSKLPRRGSAAGRNAAMVALPPVEAARWPSRASPSFSACIRSARTRRVVAEAHLGLGRVHVDVDLARRQRHEQRHDRMAVARQIVGIGAADDADQELVAHRAAVDEQILPERVGAAVRRQPGVAFDHDAVALGAHLDGVGAEFRAEHVGEPRQPPGRARQRRGPGHRRALVAAEREGDVRPAHRQPPHHLAHGLGFAAVALEELQPRRRGVEQVVDLDAGAFGQRRGLDLRLGAAVDRDRPGVAARRAWRVVMVSRATEPIEGSASPRKPSVLICSRSSPSSLEVAWRSTARSRSARVMPAPSSATRMSRRPPPSVAISIRRAPASSAFSTSSLTTLAGRSTTSPAAMRLTSGFGKLADGHVERPDSDRAAELYRRNDGRREGRRPKCPRYSNEGLLCRWRFDDRSGASCLPGASAWRPWSAWWRGAGSA